MYGKFHWSEKGLKVNCIKNTMLKAVTLLHDIFVEKVSVQEGTLYIPHNPNWVLLQTVNTQLVRRNSALSGYTLFTNMFLKGYPLEAKTAPKN